MGELMDVLDPALSSAPRCKRHYRGRRLAESNSTLDAFAHNEVVLLLNILAYEVVHAERCLMEAATKEGWSLRRFREHVLRAAARVVVSASPWLSGKPSPGSGTCSGRDWNACDTPSRSPRPAKPDRDTGPPPNLPAKVPLVSEPAQSPHLDPQAAV